MPENVCPSCGFTGNAPDDLDCRRCGFPLGENAVETADPASGTDPASAPPAPSAGEPPNAPEPEVAIPPAPSPVMRPIPRPARFRPRPRRVDPTSATLWIVFGGFAAMVVLWIAIQSSMRKPAPPQVPGSNPTLQAAADSLNLILARDSTNVDARQRLADIYYDTANWDPAIIQYRAVLRLDSTRTTALVDLGVCYFNLANSALAEDLFMAALKREPQHPVALFNLGIVYETRENYPKALDFFQRTLESNPPEAMHSPIVQSIQRVRGKMSAKP
jgi:cytochrome c-type biogenesis protein CcmH/NrfG